MGDCAINAMLRAALAKEVALWRAQFGAYIAFTRNDFNKCFSAAFCRVQVGLKHSIDTHTHTHARARDHTTMHSHIHTHTCCQEQLIAELLANPLPSPPAPLETVDLQAAAVPPHIVDGTEITIHDLMVNQDDRPLKDKDLNEWLDAREKMGFDKMKDSQGLGLWMLTLTPFARWPGSTPKTQTN